MLILFLYLQTSVAVTIYERRWRTFHVRQENIWSALILQLLQDNMNSVANEAEKKNADDQEILDIMNTVIDGTQMYLLLTSLYSTVGGYWAVWNKNTSNREHGISERVNKANIEKSINHWSPEKVRKAVSEINGTQKRQVQRIMEKGKAAGASNKELAAQVRNNPYMPSHASVISRVNVVSAANRGTYEAGLQSEYLQVKTWYNQGDNKVRDPAGPINFSQYTHVDVDGVTIPIDQPFLGTYGYIQYPGDPEAAFGNIVNCRCFMTVTTMIDKNGKPIPKKMPGITVIMPSDRIPGNTTSADGVTVTTPDPDITVIRPGEIRRPNTITF